MGFNNLFMWIEIWGGGGVGAEGKAHRLLLRGFKENFFCLHLKQKAGPMFKTSIGEYKLGWHGSFGTKQHFYTLFISYLSLACLLIFICRRQFFQLTGCLNGPLISLKWQSVNMHKKGMQLACVWFSAAWFHWQVYPQCW